MLVFSANFPSWLLQWIINQITSAVYHPGRERTTRLMKGLTREKKQTSNILIELRDFATTYCYETQAAGLSMQTGGGVLHRAGPKVAGCKTTPRPGNYQLGQHNMLDFQSAVLHGAERQRYVLEAAFPLNAESGPTPISSRSFVRETNQLFFSSPQTRSCMVEVRKNQKGTKATQALKKKQKYFLVSVVSTELGSHSLSVATAGHFLHFPLFEICILWVFCFS